MCLCMNLVYLRLISRLYVVRWYFRLNFGDLMFLCSDFRSDLLYFHVFLGLGSRLYGLMIFMLVSCMNSGDSLLWFSVGFGYFYVIFFWGGGGVRLRFYGLMIFFCLVSVVFPACILMIYCLIVLIFNRICVILCDSKMLHSLVIVDLPIPSCLVPLKQYWSCWFFIKLSLKAPLFALGEHWCNYIYFQYLY